ncbi:unnamed protein product [Calypogeia fissa]
MTSPPGEDMSMPSQVEEPIEQTPMVNEAVVAPPADQKPPTIDQVALTKKRKRRRDTWPLPTSISMQGADYRVPHPTRTLQDYPEYMQPIIQANMIKEEETPMQKVAQLQTKDFTHGLCEVLFLQIYHYNKDLMKWTRGAATEVTTLHEQLDACQARVKSQEELQSIKVLQQEKVEWEEEKRRLANDVILERNIASKAIAENADLKRLVDKDMATLYNQARQILDQDAQILYMTTTMIQKDNEIQLLMLENSSLKDTIQRLEVDNIKAEQARDEAQLEASIANDKEQQLMERILELEKQSATLSTDLPNKRQRPT